MKNTKKANSTNSTNSTNESKDYSLNNFENYNKNLDYKTNDIIEKYLLLSNEFLKFILEKLKLKNNNYSKFIIIRGYETITNIFNIVLYITKNLDLTFYHCQKAYYYYIEFIEQISNLDNILLQLNSRDATTYVYKKTLYELHHDTKKIMPPCSNNIKVLIKNMDEYLKIFKNVFEFILDFLDLNNLLINTKLIDKFKTTCLKIFIINIKKNNDITKLYNKIDCANKDFLDNNLINKDSVIDDYLEYIIQKFQ
jgi:hypothetical protein